MATHPDHPKKHLTREVEDPRADNPSRFQPEYVSGGVDHDQEHWEKARARFVNRDVESVASELAGTKLSTGTGQDA
jgi:hypothetical protein